MQQGLASDGAAFEVILRRSRQARRLSLRVSGLDGRVTLTMPARMREAEALAFVRSREDWIRAALSRVETACAVGPGTVLPVLGQSLVIAAEPGRGAIRQDGDRLIVPGQGGAVGRRLAVWLRFQAQERLVAACDHYESLLGRRRSRLVLRDTRSRWGSCSAAGSLMFNWRLVLAPPEVLEYVAAHEVAHLAEMNHSPRYWATLAKLMPGYDVHRDWLRQHGAGLHRWRFDAIDG